MAAPCHLCGATGRHLCLFCQACGAYTLRRQDHRGRWRCIPCSERRRLLAVRHVGYGRFVVKRLDLGIWGPPQRLDRPSLQDIYND